MGAAAAWPAQWGAKAGGGGGMRLPPKSILAALLPCRGHGGGSAPPVLTYAAQLGRLTDAGYALWDVLGAARVRNSDDGSISKAASAPNDVRGLLERTPTLRRLVFASGMASARLFVQHNRAWLLAGAPPRTGTEHTGAAPGSAAAASASWRFVMADDDATRACFGRVLCGANDRVAACSAAAAALGGRPPGRDSPPPRVVELVVPPSVSPACAKQTYAQKRDAWLRLVFVGSGSDDD